MLEALLSLGKDPQSIDIYTRTVAKYYEDLYIDRLGETTASVHVWSPDNKYIDNSIPSYGPRIRVPNPEVDILFITSKTSDPKDQQLTEMFKSAFRGATVCEVSNTKEIAKVLDDLAAKGKKDLVIGIADHGAPGNQYAGNGATQHDAAQNSITDPDAQLNLGRDSHDAFVAFTTSARNANVATIYLMGCNVAGSLTTDNEGGANLLRALAMKTGATVIGNTATVVPGFPNSFAVINDKRYGNRPAQITVRAVPLPPGDE